MQKHSANNTKHSKYKYTYYQNTLTVVKNTHTLQNPHIHTPKHYKTHTHPHSHIVGIQ